ncbi:MAG TPA: 6-pyruvoyl-tetrahydropterin synthase-related protein [candidate division Zixibacteria bacterium]|nr:6-pyruvoyl-tetrahydropterin synthase-related protein [candidate division Zixibacteria bacterium]
MANSYVDYQVVDRYPFRQANRGYIAVNAFQKLRSGNYRDSSALHLLVITILGLPLITPLLHWSSVPCTHDGHLHYHRIAAMRHAWESGIPFARWLPDVAFGYGYPFFIFREGPPLYLPLIPHLAGLALPAAINLFYILSIFASGWFMYLWVRDIFNPRSAIISAVAYMAAPYLLIDALIRGNQPESMALALFPLILWAGRRFIIKGRATSFVIVSLSLALLALSHNISVLLFIPFLFIYLICVGWSRQIPWKPLAIRVLLIFGLGLGLAAFYLGPALLELDEITISQSVSNRNNNFRFNFASLGEIFSPVSPIDKTLLNPPLLLRLGWVPVLLSFLGVVSLKWARSRERRVHIIFMALSAAALLLMALPISLPIWEGLPLIEFVQFPWRFIGRAALPVAFLSGVSFTYFPDRYLLFKRKLPLASILTMVAAIFLILEAFPHLYPHICLEEPQPTINTVHAYEHSSGLVGVDPAGSYFPKSVKVRPSSSPLEVDYIAGDQPQRFDRTSLPPTAMVKDINYSGLNGHMVVDSPEPFLARYLSFAYPGWKATVDGEQVSISASDPEGLITFPVPAGLHVVEVSWRMTPSRAVMAGISIAAAILIIFIAILLVRRGARKEDTSGSESGGGILPAENGINLAVQEYDEEGADHNRSPYRLDWLTLTLLVATGAGLLLFKVLVVDSDQVTRRQQEQLPVDIRTEIVAGELGLGGYNIGQKSIDSGQSFDIDLAWRVLEQPAADYQSNLWLVGPEGMIWSDKETSRPRIYEDTSPSRFWQPGQWTWDSRQVEVLEGTPPGSYSIVLILFDRDTLMPLTLIGQDGAAIGPETVIGKIEVTLPGTSADVLPQYATDLDIDGLTLIGYNQDRYDVSPGESFLVTLFWETKQESKSNNNELSLVLVDDSGELVQRWSIPPVRFDYPPSDWPTGVVFRGQHALQLDPGLDSGLYTYRLEGADLGRVRVGELERLFDQPNYDDEIDANFDNLAEMIGLTIDTDEFDQAGPISVTIVWRGLAEMPISYRVFVHLVNGVGDIVAQSDGDPAGWTRPTTGWLPGEYVVDPHVLGPLYLEQGEEYALRIGLYDPATGTRLTSSGEEFIIHRLENINR